MNTYFKTRDFVFAALIAAGMFVVSGITIPMTLHVPIPGLANVVFAPFCAFLLVLGLARLRKPGALFLIALINGLVSLPISPVIFSFVVAGGLFADGVSSLIFRGYRTRAAQITGAVLFQLGIFPAAKFFSHFYMPEKYQAIAAHIMLLAEGAILIVGLAGAWGGVKVVQELARAGKMPAEGE